MDANEYIKEIELRTGELMHNALALSRDLRHWNTQKLFAHIYQQLELFYLELQILKDSSLPIDNRIRDSTERIFKQLKASRERLDNRLHKNMKVGSHNEDWVRIRDFSLKLRDLLISVSGRRSLNFTGEVELEVNPEVLWKVASQHRNKKKAAKAPSEQRRYEEQPSYVTFGFFEVSFGRRRPLPLHEGFTADTAYTLAVAIGFVPDARFGGYGEPPPVERPEVKESTLQLHVAAFARGQHIKIIGKPLAVMDWPHGRSTENPAEFVLETDKVEHPTTATLDVYIYYRTHLLYTSRFNIRIEPEGHIWQDNERPIRWFYREDLVENRPRLFARFRALGMLTERALNLAIQAGSEKDEYQLTAFVGRAVYPARVTMNRADLTHHIVRMRQQLDELRRNPLFLVGGYDERGVYTGDFTGPRGGYNGQGEGLRRADTREVFNKFLKDMALLGSQFRDDLFGSESARILLRIIGDNLQSGDKIQVWIDRDATDFVFPWTWVYDSTLDPAYRHVINKNLFWGYNYVIEQIPNFPETLSRETAPSEIPMDRMKINVGVFNFEPTTKVQRQYFAELAERSRGKIQYDVWDDDGTWEAFLPKCDSQILYFFSHGHTAKPRGIGGYPFYDMFAAWRGWVEQAAKQESGPMRRHRESGLDWLQNFELEPSLVDETFIRLQRGNLLHRELRQLMKLDVTRPLVFLNMCESAQVFPGLSNSLIDVFLRKGARAVVGTEIPMLDEFADVFARDLFNDLFSAPLSEPPVSAMPRSLGVALWRLRQKYLDAGNPLGFAYTAFGDVDTYFGFSSVQQETHQAEGGSEPQTIEANHDE